MVYIINADWYFKLHWMDRAKAALACYDVHVLCPSNNKDFIRECEELGISFTNINLSRTGLNPFVEIINAFELKNVLKELNPDIIHSVTIKPNLYMAILNPKDCAIVLTFAGLGTLRTSSGLVGIMFMKFVKVILNRLNRKNDVCALFENQEDMDFLSSGYGLLRSKCRRVYGAGVNVDSYRMTEIPNTEIPTVLFASRMLKDKGLEPLIGAVKELRSQGININLKVAGILDTESPLSYTKEEILEMSITHNFTWLGQRDDMPFLISESNVVCLPTRYGEGVPRILIEALSCGRPIVTSSYGGCKDICINEITGFVIDPHDVEDIASALERITSDRSLATELGINGRKLIEDKYSNTIIIKENLDIYSSITK